MLYLTFKETVSEAVVFHNRLGEREVNSFPFFVDKLSIFDKNK